MRKYLTIQYQNMNPNYLILAKLSTPVAKMEKSWSAANQGWPKLQPSWSLTSAFSRSTKNGEILIKLTMSSNNNLSALQTWKQSSKCYPKTKTTKKTRVRASEDQLPHQWSLNWQLLSLRQWTSNKLLRFSKHNWMSHMHKSKWSKWSSPNLPSSSQLSQLENLRSLKSNSSQDNSVSKTSWC